MLRERVDGCNIPQVTMAVGWRGRCLPLRAEERPPAGTIPSYYIIDMFIPSTSLPRLVTTTIMTSVLTIPSRTPQRLHRPVATGGYIYKWKPARSDKQLCRFLPVQRPCILSTAIHTQPVTLRPILWLNNRNVYAAQNIAVMGSVSMYVEKSAARSTAMMLGLRV